MTPDEFARSLSDAYPKGIPAVQLQRIKAIVGELPEHGLRHFLDFVLDGCKFTPNAHAVRECMRAYVRDAPSDAHEFGGSAYDCAIGECDGTGFRPVKVRHEGELYDAVTMCACHAGHRRAI